MSRFLLHLRCVMTHLKMQRRILCGTLGRQPVSMHEPFLIAWFGYCRGPAKFVCYLAVRVVSVLFISTRLEVVCSSRCCSPDSNVLCRQVIPRTSSAATGRTYGVSRAVRAPTEVKGVRGSHGPISESCPLHFSQRFILEFFTRSTSHVDNAGSGSEKTRLRFC